MHESALPYILPKRHSEMATRCVYIAKTVQYVNIFFPHSPTNLHLMEYMLDFKFQNAVNLYNTVTLSYGRDSARLVSDLPDKEPDGNGGGISRKLF